MNATASISIAYFISRNHVTYTSVMTTSFVFWGAFEAGAGVVAFLGGAMHFVQMVDTSVLMTGDTKEVTCVLGLPPGLKMMLVSTPDDDLVWRLQL